MCLCSIYYYLVIISSRHILLANLFFQDPADETIEVYLFYIITIQASDIVEIKFIFGDEVVFVVFLDIVLVRPQLPCIYTSELPLLENCIS